MITILVLLSVSLPTTLEEKITQLLCFYTEEAETWLGSIAYIFIKLFSAEHSAFILFCRLSHMISDEMRLGVVPTELLLVVYFDQK